MDLILDGETHRLDTSDCANLAELVALAERCEQPEEACVVVAVEIDGQPLSPDALAELDQHPLDGVARVEIERRPARVVALSVLVQGAEYAQRICLAIDEAARVYRAGRSPEANERLAELTDSLTVLSGITATVANVLETERESLSDLQSGIVPWLEQLVEAQRQADPLLIADLLEYEIRPRIEAWGGHLRSVGEDAPAPRAGSAPPLSN